MINFHICIEWYPFYCIYECRKKEIDEKIRKFDIFGNVSAFVYKVIKRLNLFYYVLSSILLYLWQIIALEIALSAFNFSNRV